MDSQWGNIFKGAKKDERGARDILKNVPVFKGLTNRELGAIERILHRREYREDEVIFNQGVAAFGMYIIEKGSVSIVYEPTGKLLAELADGEFFGELALLDNSPRSAAAVAKAPTTMLGFFQSDLFDLVERNPKLGVKVMTNLSRVIGERLKISNGQLQAAEGELAELKLRTQLT